MTSIAPFGPSILVLAKSVHPIIAKSTSRTAGPGGSGSGKGSHGSCIVSPGRIARGRGIGSSTAYRWPLMTGLQVRSLVLTVKSFEL
jgi:hypothetical protein